MVVGVVLTAAVTVATFAAHTSNEQRLLRQRTREAGTVFTAALPTIQTPLLSTAEVAEITNGDPATFQRALASQVGPNPGQRFVAAALWSPADPSRPLATIGAPLRLLDRPPDQIRAFLDHAAASTTLAVIPLLDGDQPRMGYAVHAAMGSRFLAYGEAPLPPNRHQLIPQSNAFSGLEFAVYVGDRTDESSLLIATVPKLPLKGNTSTETIPFGDTSLRLVVASSSELGGGLLQALPWLLLALGAALTVASAAVSYRLVRRRQQAEGLAADNERLYREQANVAQTLQHSLLPDRLPTPPGVDLAVRYQPGTAALDVGGDWYDVMTLDDDHLLLVVGDVSGRGLRAASLMASLRYAVRAFASQGDAPDVVLTKLGRLIDVERDGHFATVLCGVLDLATRTCHLANAGHLDPLLVDANSAAYAGTEAGPPIGVFADPAYPVATVELGASALLAFTDGLVERPGETIDVGLDRLASVARAAATRPLEDLLDEVVACLVSGTIDDVAILGVRWRT